MLIISNNVDFTNVRDATCRVRWSFRSNVLSHIWQSCCPCRFGAGGVAIGAAAVCGGGDVPMMDDQSELIVGGHQCSIKVSRDAEMQEHKRDVGSQGYRGEWGKGCATSGKFVVVGRQKKRIRVGDLLY